MHATVCLLHAGRPTRADDAAKLGQFIGRLLWVTGDPIGLKGLTKIKKINDWYHDVKNYNAVNIVLPGQVKTSRTSLTGVSF